ncbi:tape measure protein [Faecalimicrobium sp. JNUCC 81]
MATIKKSATMGEMFNRMTNTMVGFASNYITIPNISEVMQLSDELINAQTRISMINDGAQSIDDLNKKIYTSAQNSRSAYEGTSQMVYSLGVNAGNAFNSTSEMVDFAEQLNKNFIMAGTSGEGINSAISQLTNGLGSGSLSAQQLNDVFKSAPNIIQSISDYLDVPTNKIFEMASKGQLSADIVKNAILSTSEETNKQFESMPTTFGQVFTSLKSQSSMAFQQILKDFNEIANSNAFQSFAYGIVTAFTLIGVVLGNLALGIANIFIQNWSIMEPLIWGLIAALIVYNATMGIAWLKTLTTAAAEAFQAIQSAILSIAIFGLILAQEGLNAALSACPLTWIIIGIIAIIALFYAAIGAINHFAGTSLSATGMIAGVFMMAGAFIGNLIIALANIVVDVFATIWNVIATVANFVGNVFTDPIGAVIRLFAGLADTVLSILSGIASTIDTIFGSNLENTINGWKKNLKGAVDGFVGEGKVFMEPVDASKFKTSKRLNYGDAFNIGNKWGSELGSKFKMENLFGNTKDKSGLGKESDLLKNLKERGPLDNLKKSNSLDGLKNSMADAGSGSKDTASNTAKMANTMTASAEDLKYLREIAEQEVINRFTTSQIKIDMNNNNNINSELDLDGVVSYLEEKVYESMVIASEGTHI